MVKARSVVACSLGRLVPSSHYIVQNQEVDIEGWVQKYRGIGLGGWSFDELREWIDGVEEEEIKERLIEAVAFFERVNSE